MKQWLKSVFTSFSISSMPLLGKSQNIPKIALWSFLKNLQFQNHSHSPRFDMEHHLWEQLYSYYKIIPLISLFTVGPCSYTAWNCGWGVGEKQESCCTTVSPPPPRSSCSLKCTDDVLYGGLLGHPTTALERSRSPFSMVEAEKRETWVKCINLFFLKNSR